MRDIDHIDDNLLAAYAEGRSGPEDTMRVLRAMAADPRLSEEVSLLRALDEEDGEEVPMERMAADMPNALCSVLCERRILRECLGRDDFDENAYLHDDGVPLFAVGGWLALRGMSVARRYDAADGDIAEELSLLHYLIAVVDPGILDGEAASGTLHAIVPLDVRGEVLHYYDPAKDGDTDIPFSRFSAAWNASRRYLVTVSMGRLLYRPHPVRTDDETLDGAIMEITETLAENVHDIWAKHIADEGWRHGDILDAGRKTHPYFVPYSDLPEDEKTLCREAALGTLRLVKKLGYEMLRGTRHCPACGSGVTDTDKFCPSCGQCLADINFCH